LRNWIKRVIGQFKINRAIVTHTFVSGELECLWLGRTDAFYSVRALPLGR
jgi:hypothetical protein